jgi:hypothetical protein
VNEVASGPKFTVLVLMEIAAHLFAQGRLVHLQLFKPMREETVLPIGAIARFGETSAELKFAFLRSSGYLFIIHNLSSHDQYSIILIPHIARILNSSLEKTNIPCSR